MTDVGCILRQIEQVTETTGKRYTKPVNGMVSDVATFIQILYFMRYLMINVLSRFSVNCGLGLCCVVL
jgi:hypothetical protein